MEEELFGREDIDNTVNEQHAADPMHPARLSVPMRWLLTENPGKTGPRGSGAAQRLCAGRSDAAASGECSRARRDARGGGPACQVAAGRAPAGEPVIVVAGCLLERRRASRWSRPAWPPPGTRRGTRGTGRYCSGWTASSRCWRSWWTWCRGTGRRPLPRPRQPGRLRGGRPAPPGPARRIYNPAGRRPPFPAGNISARLSGRRPRGQQLPLDPGGAYRAVRPAPEAVGMAVRAPPAAAPAVAQLGELVTAVPHPGTRVLAEEPGAAFQALFHAAAVFREPAQPRGETSCHAGQSGRTARRGAAGAPAYRGRDGPQASGPRWPSASW